MMRLPLATAGVAAVARFRAVRPGPGRVWTVDPPEPGMIERPDLAGAVTAALTGVDGGRVGIGTGLYGAGGFGKTTLAQQVGTSPAVRRRFRHALWVTVGEQPTTSGLVEQVNGLCGKLSDQHRRVDDLEQAGPFDAAAIYARQVWRPS